MDVATQQRELLAENQAKLLALEHDIRARFLGTKHHAAQVQPLAVSIKRLDLVSTTKAERIQTLYADYAALRSVVFEQRARLAPIRSVPVEVLLEIFEVYVEAGGSQWHIAPVCRQWIDIVVGNPHRLWYEILFQAPQDWMVSRPSVFRGPELRCATLQGFQHLVERCKGSQLVVTLDLDSGGQGNHIPIVPILEFFHEHVLSRCRVFKILGIRCPTTNEAEKLGSLPFPLPLTNLQELECGSSLPGLYFSKLMSEVERTAVHLSHFTIGLQYNFRLSTYPSLSKRLSSFCYHDRSRSRARALRIRDVAHIPNLKIEQADFEVVDKEQGELLPQIETLHLKNSVFGFPLGSTIPNLRTLVFGDGTCWSSGVDTEQVISLPRLKTLSIPAETWSLELVAHLECPSLRDLTLGGQMSSYGLAVGKCDTLMKSIFHGGSSQLKPQTLKLNCRMGQGALIYCLRRLPTVESLDITPQNSGMIGTQFFAALATVVEVEAEDGTAGKLVGKLLPRLKALIFGVRWKNWGALVDPTWTGWETVGKIIKSRLDGERGIRKFQVGEYDLLSAGL